MPTCERKPSTLTAPAREVPILEQAEVAVVGCGVGGFCAAVAAARAGARTVVLERSAFPGGAATAGLMCSITNHFVTRDGTQVTRGLAAEFVNRLVQEGGAMPRWARAEQPQIPNDPEAAKRAMISMLREAGVTTLYRAFLAQVLCEGEEVSLAIFTAKGGAFAVRAPQWVDATGDLDLVALAGGPCAAEPGFSSLLFRMADVDIDAVVNWFEQHPESYSETADIPTSLADTLANWRDHGVFHLPHYAGKRISVVQEAIARGELPESFGRHVKHLWALGMYSCRANRGVVLINTGAFLGDEFDPLRSSQCEEEGRLAAKVVADFLVRRFPGFAAAHLIDTAAEVGSRYTRRLRGRHTLTAEEYAGGRHFPDVVGRATEIDRSATPPARYEQAGEIPFGCLVAEAPANVICGSGKSASTDPRGLLRGQVQCMVIGEAAGAAAALAARAGVPVNCLQVTALQAHLRQQGVSLGEG